jgi:thymidylate synthase (FAD)
MKVTLVDHTENAAEKLIFSKSTRLKMTPGGLDEIMKWSDEAKLNELRYISKTIRSSWEFVSITVMIEGVSRAFTHQWVRNRQCSHAQQTMRILDVGDFEYIAGPSLTNDNMATYRRIMGHIAKTYNNLIDRGVEIEDARGILPTNISTNIMTRMNLRTLAELVSSRSSPRTQGEFRDVLDSIKEEVLKVWPWAELMMCDQKTEAASELDKMIDKNFAGAEKLSLIKLVDILRK